MRNNHSNIAQLNFVQEKNRENKRQNNVNLESQLKKNLVLIKNGIR